jgi:hypothetical protein
MNKAELVKSLQSILDGTGSSFAVLTTYIEINFGKSGLDALKEDLKTFHIKGLDPEKTAQKIIDSVHNFDNA